MINIAWPRTPDAAWYDNYLVALSAVVGVGIGAIYMVLAKPYLRSEALSGDAIPTAFSSTTTTSDPPDPPRRIR